MKDIGKIKDYEKEDLRFATPLNVAKRRAEDLKCKRIADLCSGIGIQSAEFAKTCSSVLGIEIDERKVEVSEKNFGNIKNLKFVCGDVVEDKIIKIVENFEPDIIFCDPERLPSEKERNLESIKPNLKELIAIYSKICKNICLEVPPRIDLNKLNSLGDFEAEYLSLDNKLNRLHLRFGNLKKNERSVTDVNTGVRICNNSKINKIRSSEKILKYLFELSEAILKADLDKEFADKTHSLLLNGCEKNRLLFTSNSLIKDDLEIFCKTYIVVGIVDRFNEINTFLRKNHFEKILIKYTINPKDYWKDRNLLETGLSGDREGVIFKINNRYVICEDYY